MAMKPEIQYINAYVSGNIAYQPERTPEKKQTVQLPKAKRQKRRVVRVDIMALGGIAAALVFSVMLVVSLVQFNRAQEEVSTLSAYVTSLQAENQQLAATYSAGYDPEEIRQIALTMGMVPADDVPHLQMQLSAPQVEQQPTAWENFWAFMVGLFA